MNSQESINEGYFGSVRTVEELLKAKDNGFVIEFRTQRPEMPGATILHEIARRCEVELLEFLIKIKGMNVNELDEDDCSPLGYVINEERVLEFRKGDRPYSTVNLGCVNKKLIIRTVELLIRSNAKSMYCGREFEAYKTREFLKELGE